jgi:hypothetical protein
MRKLKLAFLLSFATTLFCATQALAENRLEVESKTVKPGARNVVIGVRVTNDRPLIALVVPLKIREVTPGAFITRLALSWGGRLDSALNDGGAIAQFDTEDYNCHGGGRGFKHIVTKTRNSPQSVNSSPAAVLFARVGINSPPLSIGSDREPSMRMTVDVTDTPGTFEVDTTCTAPANHLVFAPASDTGIINIVPTFVKGTITIAP